MKKLIILLFAFALTANLTAQNRKSHNIDYGNTALKGYSPVSYLDLGLAQLGDKNFKAVHEGIDYYFTSAEQKTTFEANPDKYKPQNGGFCSFGMYKGKKFLPHPDKFIVKDGKYFVFAYDHYLGDAKEFWLKGDHYEREAKATKNWQELQLTY